MGKTSEISWTDATWNIAVGCTKVDADCKFCYMYRDGQRFNYDARKVNRTKRAFTLPLQIKEPSKIFTCSLTDFFHPSIDAYRHEAWDIIRRCPQHTFQILTKRPERIRKCLPDDWGEGYPNVWLGTSCGSQQSANARIPHLLCAPAQCHFLSLEPLHGPIDLTHVVANDAQVFGFVGPDGNPLPPSLEVTFNCLGEANDLLPYTIDWVIVGGESGNDIGQYRYRPCELHWLQDIVDKCQNEHIPVFVKQLGTHLQKQLGLKTRHATNIDEFPATLQIRQFPNP